MFKNFIPQALQLSMVWRSFSVSSAISFKLSFNSDITRLNCTSCVAMIVPTSLSVPTAAAEEIIETDYFLRSPVNIIVDMLNYLR